VSVREYFFKSFDEEVKEVINYFLTDADGTNIYDEVLSLSLLAPHRKPSLFHYFYTAYSIDLHEDPVKGYPWGEIVDGGHTLYSKFIGGLIPRKVDPEHFMEVWTNPGAPRPLPALSGASSP